MRFLFGICAAVDERAVQCMMVRTGAVEHVAHVQGGYWQGGHDPALDTAVG